MSSTKFWSQKIEAWILLGASILMMLWYAKAQILYTLHFTYQVAHTLFPNIIPFIEPPG